MRRIELRSSVVSVAAVLLCCLVAPAILAEEGPLREEVQEQFEAARSAYYEGNYEKAAELLDKVLATSTVKELIVLRERVDRGLLIKMLRHPELGPRAWDILRKSTEESARIRRDPSEIKTLIEGLGSDDVAVRWGAINQLAIVGPFAVPFLLDEAITKEKAVPSGRKMWALAALRKMRSDAVPPLVVALQHADDSGAEQLVDLIAEVPDARALPALAGVREDTKRNLYSRAAARKAMETVLGGLGAPTGRRWGWRKESQLPAAASACRALAARYYYNDPTIVEATRVGDRVIWQWSPEGKTFADRLIFEDVPAYAFPRLTAQGLILQGMAHDRSEPGLPALHICNSFMRLVEARANGADSSSLEEMQLLNESLGAASFCRALGRALRDGNRGLALYCIESVRRIGDPRAGGNPDTLLTALRYPDGQVRAAAAETIMRLNPEGRFGTPKAVVRVLAAALGLRARSMIGILSWDPVFSRDTSRIMSDFAFHPIVYLSASKALHQAKSKVPPLDALIIDTRLRGNKPVGLVKAIRSDAATAALPVILVAREEIVQEVREAFGTDVSTVLSLQYQKEELEAAVSGALEAREADKGADIRKNAELLQRILTTAASIPPRTRYPMRVLSVGAARLLEGYPDEIRGLALDTIANAPDRRLRDVVLALFADDEAAVELRLKAGTTLVQLVVISPTLDRDQVALLRKIVAEGDASLRAQAARVLAVAAIPQRERETIFLPASAAAPEE